MKNRDLGVAHVLKQAKPSLLCTKLSKTKPITLKLREKHLKNNDFVFPNAIIKKNVDAATAPMNDRSLSTRRI